jgi:hypothetical protein
MSTRRTTYTTEDEIQFIDEIKSRTTKKGIVITRLQKLQSYKESLNTKEDWGQVDKKKITKYLDKQIKNEEKLSGISEFEKHKIMGNIL